MRIRTLSLTLVVALLLAGHAAAQNIFQARDSSGQGTCRMEPGAAHDFCGLPYELSNFQGHFKCDEGVIIGRPANFQELARLVEAYDKVKAVGVGHSWWKEQFCAGESSKAINIVTTELQEVRAGGAIQVDESSMTVTAPAGVTQRTLLEFLDAYRTDKSPDGYTLGAFAWYLDQTIGGAISTATHGSSLVYGSLSSQAVGLKMMIANGTIIDVSRDTNPHLWKAASTSVGRLGIILEVKLSIVKNLPVRRTKQDIKPAEFVSDIQALSSSYSEAVKSNSQYSLAVWEAMKDWSETQLFWFIPSEQLWKATFKRQSALTPDEVQQVLATDGPDTLLPGAFAQQKVESVSSVVGISVNPKFWSGQFMNFLGQNVAPGLLPARQAYLSVTELESRISAGLNAYDQHEGAIPLSKAGECVAALADELYGPNESWKGFRTPALVRLIRAENAYLSPAHGEPVLYINIEDHVSYATGKPNQGFDAIMKILRSPTCGPARLHWGKAGWPKWASCFDGAKEFPKWCDFGCAVQELDPYGKFAAMSDVWRWRAQGNHGREVDFASCCSASGFDTARCTCASRGGC